MIIEIKIAITSEKIQIFVPQINYTQETLNVVALNPKRQRVYGFGESKEQIRQKAGERWDEFKDDMVFKAAFNLADPDLELDKYVLWRSLEDAYRRVRSSRGLVKLLYQAVDQFDVDLKFNGYDQISTDHSQALEYFLQSELRARKLTVNGKTVEISPSLRSLEAWVRILFTLTIPYLIIGIGVFTALGLPEDQLPWNSSLLTIGLIIALGLVLETAGKAAWMVLMKRIVPASYLRHFLPRLPLQAVTNWLANIFLA